MPTIVLRDEFGIDLGFLLVAGDGKLVPGTERDLILMGLPLANESALSLFVGQNMHTEFQALVSGDESTLKIAFSVVSGLAVLVQLTRAGTGSWEVPGVGRGLCSALPGSAQSAAIPEV